MLALMCDKKKKAFSRFGWAHAIAVASEDSTVSHGELMSRITRVRQALGKVYDSLPPTVRPKSSYPQRTDLWEATEHLSALQSGLAMGYNLGFKSGSDYMFTARVPKVCISCG